MRVVLAQLLPEANEPAANGETVSAVLQAHPDADLVVFPELFLSGYELGITSDLIDECLRQVRELTGPAMDCGTAVIVGAPVDDGNGVANAVCCIDVDGSVRCWYRKVALFSNEAAAFNPGSELVCVSLAGCSVGPLICFDVEFPEYARSLARAGAELLAVPSANMSPFFQDHAILTRARALENRRPVVYVNQVGHSGEFDFVGGSRAIADDGDVVLELPQDDEGVAEVEIDIGRPITPEVDYLRIPLADVTVTRIDRAQTGVLRDPL